MNGNPRWGRILQQVSGARHILVVVSLSLACVVSSQSSANDVPPCAITVLPVAEEGGGYGLALTADNEARRQECLGQLEPYLSSTAIELLSSQKPPVTASFFSGAATASTLILCLSKISGGCKQMFVTHPSMCGC